jgi:ABC-type nickel/cobalt efflux system permease component RcnA
MRRSLFSILTLFLLPTAVGAHPVPKDNHDRTLVVRITPGALVVDYRLEVDEVRAIRDLPEAILREVKNKDDLRQRFLDYFADVLARHLDAKLDGQELKFRCVRKTSLLLDHIRCDYRFVADWAPSADADHSLTFREGNYWDDDFSVLRLSLAAGQGIELRELTAPDEALLNRPPEKRRPDDAERLRKASAQFRLKPAHRPIELKAGLPPDPESARGGPDEPSDAAGASTGAPNDRPKPRPGPAPGEVVAEGKGDGIPGEQQDQTGTDESPGDDRIPGAASVPAATETHRLLDLLLDTRLGLGLLLLLSAAFGGVHALTPGHGKTLVAAYLVGQRGTVGHALLLGVVTTLTHTSAVLVLALVLWLAFPDRTPPGLETALGLVGGLLITGLGTWLLFQRLAGRADHFHIGGGHHHHHDHPHPARATPGPSTQVQSALPEASGPAPPLDSRAVGKRVGIGGLITLGIGGGLVPCWDAVGMLLFAISANRLRLALPMLLSFSAGLAGVLVAIGIGVVWARNAAVNRWGESELLGRFMRFLPLFSAVAVIGLGLGLCYETVYDTGH